jgi:hypothetical protein
MPYILTDMTAQRWRYRPHRRLLILPANLRTEDALDAAALCLAASVADLGPEPMERLPHHAALRWQQARERLQEKMR